MTSAFGQSIGNGLYNVGTGALSAVHEVVTVPIDILRTSIDIVYDTNYQPWSYYGQSSQQQVQRGRSPEQIAGDVAPDIATYGLWSYGRGFHHYADTGDPTDLQKAAGGMFGSSLVGYGGKKVGGAVSRWMKGTIKPCVRSATPIPEGYTRAYRAVSQAEYQQILQTGRFEVPPG